jgi:hypothetical protein
MARLGQEIARYACTSLNRFIDSKARTPGCPRVLVFFDSFQLLTPCGSGNFART